MMDLYQKRVETENKNELNSQILKESIAKKEEIRRKYLLEKVERAKKLGNLKE